MIYIAQLYILICTLFLAGHDSTSYLLGEGRTTTGPLLFKRIDRWHRDGAVIFGLVIMAILLGLCRYDSFVDFYRSINWKIIIAAFLIRLSFFDIVFNLYSSLPVKRLGTTSNLDKFFTNIFGINGALKKSLLFFITLILLNILNHYLLR